MVIRINIELMQVRKCYFVNVSLIKIDFPFMVIRINIELVRFRKFYFVNVSLI